MSENLSRILEEIRITNNISVRMNFLVKELKRELNKLNKQSE